MTFEMVEALDKADLKCVEPNDLVRRMQAGCMDSATELSNRFMPRLLLLLERRLAGRRTDAEDIAQESLTRAFLQLDKFDFRYQFSTWLYTIAFRMASDFIRKEKRRPKSVTMDASLHDPTAASSRDLQGSIVDDVWYLANSILEESQYTILWLKYGESLSIKEIAHVVKRTEIMVRVQLHRARSKMAKEIRRMDREEMVTRNNVKQVS